MIQRGRQREGGRTAATYTRKSLEKRYLFLIFHNYHGNKWRIPPAITLSGTPAIGQRHDVAAKTATRRVSCLKYFYHFVKFTTEKASSPVAAGEDQRLAAVRQCHAIPVRKRNGLESNIKREYT